MAASIKAGGSGYFLVNGKPYQRGAYEASYSGGAAGAETHVRIFSIDTSDGIRDILSLTEISTIESDSGTYADAAELKAALETFFFRNIGGGGGGAVDSVNGQTGSVVLNLNNINDVPPYPNDGNDYVLVENNGVLTWEVPGGAVFVEMPTGGTILKEDQGKTVVVGDGTDDAYTLDVVAGDSFDNPQSSGFWFIKPYGQVALTWNSASIVMYEEDQIVSFGDITLEDTKFYVLTRIDNSGNKFRIVDITKPEPDIDQALVTAISPINQGSFGTLVCFPIIPVSGQAYSKIRLTLNISNKAGATNPQALDIYYSTNDSQDTTGDTLLKSIPIDIDSQTAGIPFEVELVEAGTLPTGTFYFKADNPGSDFEYKDLTIQVFA